MINMQKEIYKVFSFPYITQSSSFSYRYPIKLFYSLFFNISLKKPCLPLLFISMLPSFFYKR